MIVPYIKIIGDEGLLSRSFRPLLLELQVRQAWTVRQDLWELWVQEATLVRLEALGLLDLQGRWVLQGAV